MSDFESVNRAAFLAAVGSAPASKSFYDAMARIDQRMLFRDFPGVDYAIRHGSLSVRGNFGVPAFHVLVLGDLSVEGLVDLRHPDEGGSFIVIGDVECVGFNSDYDKGVLIDGNLAARDAILNSYEDSGMCVTGNLKTRFFFGEDIWAEVGGRAEMDYGVGYCLPLGYVDAAGEAVEPCFDEETSLDRLLVSGEGSDLRDELRELLHRGEPILKS